MNCNKIRIVLPVFAVLLSGPARAQNAPLPSNPTQAVKPASPALPAKETPPGLGVWGPYAATHLGPVCVTRAGAVAFPLRIGQRRSLTVPVRDALPGGKFKTRYVEGAQERSTQGLAPTPSTGSDAPNGGVRSASPTDGTALNAIAPVAGGPGPTAWPSEADSNGLLWRVRADLPSEGDWPALQTEVTYFPAFAEPQTDGLLVRVAITNPGKTAQTCFADLLGGSQTDSIAPEAKPDQQASLYQAGKASPHFALCGQSLPYPLRFASVNDAFLTPGIVTLQPGADGTIMPAAFAGTSLVGAARVPRWVLTRLDNIVVEPGQTVAVWFSIGAAESDEDAIAGAKTLLSLAEDSQPGGVLREGLYTLAVRAHERAMPSGLPPGLSRLWAQSLANAPVPRVRGVLDVSSRRQAVGISEQRGREETLWTARLGSVTLGWAQIEPLLAVAELKPAMQLIGEHEKDGSPAYSLLILFALHALTENVHERSSDADAYAAARRLYQWFRTPRGGQAATPDGLALNGKLNDWDALLVSEGRPSGAEAGTNAANVATPSPRFAAQLLRAARIVRGLALQAAAPPPDVAALDKDIARLTALLTAPAGSDDSRILPIVPANDPLLLVAGADALTPTTRQALLQTLTDPNGLWSAWGLRSRSKIGPDYRPDQPGEGAIEFGTQWLYWTTLLDLGETDTARKLADNVLNAYIAAQTQSGGCPAWLHGDGGAAGGWLDSAGNAGVLLPLWAAYHTPGTVTTGWNLHQLDRRYNPKTDTLRLTFKAHTPGQAILLCAMNKPNGRYTLTGSVTQTLTADANGAITLSHLWDTTTQQIDIVPVPDAAR